MGRNPKGKDRLPIAMLVSRRVNLGISKDFSCFELPSDPDFSRVKNETTGRLETKIRIFEEAKEMTPSLEVKDH